MAWTSPRTWVAGEVVTAALLNTHLRDQLLELNGTASAWTAYTPTFTDLTLGNGTLVAGYKQAGKSVMFRFRLTWGSTTVANANNTTFSLPVTGRAVALAGLLTVNMYDASATTSYTGTAPVASGASTATVSPHNSLPLNAVRPFTWATSDVLDVGGVYEAA